MQAIRPNGGDERVDEPLRAEANRVAGGQAGLLLRGLDRAPGVGLVEVPRVQRDAGDAGLPRDQRHALVQLDELAERRNREALVVGDVPLSGLVAEDEEMRRRPVVQAERDARVLRMEQRALALDEQQLSPAPVSLDDEPLGRAGDEVGDRRVDRDAPAGDCDSGLARRHELRGDAAPPRLAVELQADGHLPDRAIGADRQDDRRRHLEVLAGRDVQVRRRLSEVAQGDVVLSRELDELGVGGQELVQAVVDVEAVLDAGADLLQERRREAAARRRDADERGVGAEAQRILDRADDREAQLRLAGALGVEQRDDLLRRVAHDAASRLAEVRVAGFALSEN